MNRLSKILFIVFLFIFVLTSCKKKDKNPDPTPTPPDPIIDPAVNYPVGISFEKEREFITIGDSVTLNAFVTPSDSEGSIEYVLSDPTGVVTYKDKVITGVKEGTVILSAKIKGENEVELSTSIKVYVRHPLLEESENKVFNIIGAFGADASHEYNIHYQTYNTSTFALVTTSDDPTFEHAVKYYGDGYYFEDLDEVLAGPFSARNIWQIECKDLKENTSYIYKIDDGNGNYSDVYHFTTAGGDSSTSFLFLTDVHYYMGTDGTNRSAAVSEETIKQALAYNSNISFIVSGGDLIDTGGNDNIWSIWYDCAKSLKALPFIGVPGNHEYYINGTGQRTNCYFAVNSAAPKNGPGDLYDSSCYFIHNETLFILIDNIKNTSYNEQLAWIAYLLENMEYKFSVLVYHCPIHCDDTGYDQNYVDLIDKYSVDLVLDGHYHTHKVFKNYYNATPTTDPYLGTTYITGGGGGVKAISSLDDALNQARGYIVDMLDDTIKVTIIYASGKIGQVIEIDRRTTDKVESISKQEMMNSLTLKANKENNTATISFSSKAYGNVKKVIVEELIREEIKDYIVLPSPSYTSITLKNVLYGYDYNFKVTVEFSDGSKESKILEYINHESVNAKMDFVFDTIACVSYSEVHEDFKYIIGKVKIYLNNELVDAYEYLEKGKATLKYNFEDLTPNTNYELKLVFTNTHGLTVFTEVLSFKTEN